MNVANETSRRPGSITGRLIAKDLYLYRWLILGSLLAGVLSLVLSGFTGGDNVTTGPNLGFLLFITSIIAFGVSLPMVVLKEHQNKSQLFVLSLPVSPAHYSISKVAAALIAFLVPWLTLTAGVVVVTAATPAPDGGIPFFVAMMTFFLCNFCLLMALTVITMSELAAIAGIGVTNVSVTVFLIQVGRLPGIEGRSQDAAASWSPAILTVLGIELAVILLALGLAFYLPSRKKDFL
jgi:ABC-2 type transport system permease protein